MKIKDSPEEDDCDVLKPCQSDAYLVVEAEQIRVIEPVSRAIQETIKLSNVSFTMGGINFVKKLKL